MRNEHVVAPLSMESWKEYWHKNFNERLNLTEFALEDIKDLSVKVPDFNNVFHVGETFIVIMDYQNVKYLHVDGSYEQMLGYTREDLVNGGIEFMFKHIHPDDKEKVMAASVHFQDYIHSQPIQKRKMLKTNLYLRMKATDGRYVRLMEQVIVVGLNGQGAVTHTFKHFTDISHLPFSDRVMLAVIDCSSGRNKVIHTAAFEDRPTPNEEHILSSREIEILRHIAQGKPSKRIAGILNLSEHTINNHRKNMLRKLGASNIAEVLNFALLSKLL
jgi:DNA-binding CsgD family transcriptional regulator